MCHQQEQGTKWLWADAEDSDDGLRADGTHEDEVGSSSTWSSASTGKLQQIRTLSNDGYKWCEVHYGWPKKSCKECRDAVRVLLNGEGSTTDQVPENEKIHTPLR